VCEENNKQKYKYRNVSENEQKENEQQNKLILEKERQEHMDSHEIEKMIKDKEELAKQVKELTKQLDYKEMYENERKECVRVEDQLREADKDKVEQYMQYVDTYKQLLEKEQEIFKHNILIEEQKKEIAQLKNLTRASEQEYLSVLESHQQFEDNIKIFCCKELNARDEVYEKRINKVVVTFNKQFKDYEEVHKKELQVKIEEVKKKEAKKLEDYEEAHKKSLTIYN